MGPGGDACLVPFAKQTLESKNETRNPEYDDRRPDWCRRTGGHVGLGRTAWRNDRRRGWRYGRGHGGGRPSGFAVMPVAIHFSTSLQKPRSAANYCARGGERLEEAPPVHGAVAERLKAAVC